MAGSPLILLPSSVRNRPGPTTERSQTTLEGSPYELLLRTLRYTDLFTRINISRCSTTLAAFIDTARLLHFNLRHPTPSDRVLLLESVPIQMRVAELKRQFTELPRSAIDQSDVEFNTETHIVSDSTSDADDTDDDMDDNNYLNDSLYLSDSESPHHLIYRVKTHPARIHCKICDFRCLQSHSINNPTLRTAWTRHIRMEVLRAGGSVPKPKLMVRLVVLALRFLVEDHERKLQRAAFLTLKVPGLAATQAD